MRPFTALALLLCAACAGPAETPPPDAAAATSGPTTVVGRAPAGALVTLEPEGGAPMPEGPAVMDQYAKAFVPDLLFVRLGQPVIFKNSEDQPHNVSVVRARTGAGVFNISQNQGDAHTHVFDLGGEYDVTCDVHPGMRATLVATAAPHAVYADARGEFAFSNIAPGRHTLRVSAQGRETVQVVDVAGVRLDLGDVRVHHGS